MEMFKFTPGASNPTISVICSDGEVISVDAKVVGVEKDYNTDKLFGVINEYIQFMEGREPGYVEKLSQCYKGINYIRQYSTNISQPTLLKLVADNVNNVLKMFDFSLIRTFIHDAIIKIIPNKMTIPYEEKRKESEWNSPEQTYGVDQYIDLVALGVMFKPVLPFYCAIINKFGGILNKEIAENIFYPIYNIDVLTLPPVTKLISWIDKHSKKDTSKKNSGGGKSTDDNIRSRVMAYGIDEEGMINYVIALLMFKELPKRYILADKPDDNSNHLISYVHSKVKSRLNPDKVNVSIFTNKSTNSGVKDSGSDGEADKESTYEGVRATEVIAASIELEADIYTKSPWFIYERLNDTVKEKIDVDLLTKMVPIGRQIEVGDITHFHIYMAKMCCISYMDPRLISYISMDSLRSVLTVGYCYLRGIGLDRLAFMLMCRTEPSIGDEGTFTLAGNKTTISDEILSTINDLYPLTKYGENRKVKSGYKNYIIDYIDNVYDIVKTLRWIPFDGMDDQVTEYFGKPRYNIPVNMKTKEDMFRVIIVSEEINYQEENKDEQL